ncbi:MAG: Arm DNA-binding domain-containing protein [Methylocystis sp.]
MTPDGAKRWRLAYRFGTAQKTLAIGVYPAVNPEGSADGA